MNSRAKIRQIGLVILILVAGVAVWQWRSIYFSYYAWRVRAKTVALPHCDRVEVCQLDGKSDPNASTGFPVRPYRGYSRIFDQKVLTGVEAESLTALWRSQKFGFEYEALCHQPAYGFRFYGGSGLKFETSVCFHCRNFT